MLPMMFDSNRGASVKEETNFDYPAGHVLYVDHGTFKHVGVSDGQGYVYEHSWRRGLGKVSVATFSRGRKIVDRGRLRGSLPPHESLVRAEDLVGDGRRYHLLRDNCEHFAHEVAGVGVGSPQVRKAVLAGLGVAGAIALRLPGLGYISLGAAAWAIYRRARSSRDGAQSGQ